MAKKHLLSVHSPQSVSHLDSLYTSSPFQTILNKVTLVWFSLMAAQYLCSGVRRPCCPQGGIAKWWEMKSFPLQSPDLARTTRARPDWAISINGVHANSFNTESKTGRERGASKQRHAACQADRNLTVTQRKPFTRINIALPSFCAAPCASSVCREINACGFKRAPQRESTSL